MKEFLIGFRNSIRILNQIDDYDDIDELKGDVEHVVTQMAQNKPEFPYFMDERSIMEILGEVIRRCQEDMAEDWVKEEPRLKYENEWDTAETISAFEEFMIVNLSKTAADEVLDVARPYIEKRVRDVLRKRTVFENITNLYEKAKHG